MPMPAFEYSMPAVRAVQAGREYFVTMSPARLLSALFPDDVPELRPELEAYRVVNKQRVPEIAKYICENIASYVLSAITASINSSVTFQPIGDSDAPACAGRLLVPMSARLIIHDGLHRCAAIKEAVARNDRLAEESIAVVIYVDPGFERSDQIFTDIKRHEHKAPASLRVFHDDRDELAHLTRELIPRVPVFVNAIEMARSTISNRSRNLFTLSALYQANRTLLADRKKEPYEAKLSSAVDFWNEVAKCVPDWTRATTGKTSPAELRKNYVHAHGIALAALARAGRTLLEKRPKTWRRDLARLKSLDWSRSNARLWEGRAMVGGRLSKSTSSVVLTGNAVKRHLGLPLSEEEAQIERQSRGTKRDG